MQNNHDPTLGVRVESLEAEKRDLAMIVSKRQLEIERLTGQYWPRHRYFQTSFFVEY